MKQKMMKFHSADGPDYEVPVPQEKYKAIGWVVEWRSKLTDSWFVHPLDVRQTKSQAIALWTGEYEKETMPKLKMRRGLTRCVRVYVEVQP